MKPLYFAFPFLGLLFLSFGWFGGGGSTTTTAEPTKVGEVTPRTWTYPPATPTPQPAPTCQVTIKVCP